MLHEDMSKKHERYLNSLVSIAATNEPAASQRLAACLVYNGSIVAIGSNQNKSHPLMKKYGKNSESIYLHAEVDAIKNALKVLSLDEISKSTLYVARVKRDPEFKTTIKGVRPIIWGNACPCKGCMRAIVNFNIKKVIYTTDDLGVFKEL